MSEEEKRTLIKFDILQPLIERAKKEQKLTKVTLKLLVGLREEEGKQTFNCFARIGVLPFVLQQIKELKNEQNFEGMNDLLTLVLEFLKQSHMFKMRKEMDSITKRVNDIKDKLSSLSEFMKDEEKKLVEAVFEFLK